MRCTECNTPFTPTQTQKGNIVLFSKVCSSCNSKFYQGYASSHEHTLGVEEEPLVRVAKEGSIKAITP